MKKKWIVALIGIAVIVTPFLFLSFTIWIPQSGFQSHAPIEIIGDLAFTSDNGVRGGVGTPEDPYIIEDWRINGEGERDCIAIVNTSAWFTIQNCVLMNQFKYTYIYDGVFLKNVTNGRLCQCQVYNIRLRKSNYNKIQNNLVTSGDFEGINADFSNDNEILGNSFTAYLSESIFVINSCNNTIVRNTCTNAGGVGIYVHGKNNTIAHNVCSNKRSSGIRLSFSDNFIVNNTCSYNEGKGIEISGATNNLVEGNTCAYNRQSGIFLEGAIDNIITGNHLIMNWLQGIQEESTSVNNFSSNVQVDNPGWIILLLFIIGIIALSLLSPKLLAIKQRNPKSKITQDLIFESFYTSIALFAVLEYSLFYFDIMGILAGIIFGIFGFLLCIRTWKGKASVFHPPTRISLIIQWILPVLGIFMASQSIAMYTWLIEMAAFVIYDTILYHQKKSAKPLVGK